MGGVIMDNVFTILYLSMWGCTIGIIMIMRYLYKKYME